MKFTNGRFRKTLKAARKFRNRKTRRARQTRRRRQRQRGGYLPHGFGGLEIEERAVRSDPLEWDDNPDNEIKEV
jgi:hypothetical protein